MDFIGIILAQQSIGANTGATVDGSLIALVGAVTLDDNNITVDNTCSTKPLLLQPPSQPILQPLLQPLLQLLPQLLLLLLLQPLPEPDLQPLRRAPRRAPKLHIPRLLLYRRGLALDIQVVRPISVRLYSWFKEKFYYLLYFLFLFLFLLTSKWVVFVSRISVKRLRAYLCYNLYFVLGLGLTVSSTNFLNRSAR
jgi:hypothetical protein